MLPLECSYATDLGDAVWIAWEGAEVPDPDLLEAEDRDAAVALAGDEVERFGLLFLEEWTGVMRRKLRLDTAQADDAELASDLLKLMREDGVDFTLGFRALSDVLRGERAAAMDRTNAIYVPRNHLVEEALDAAEADLDLASFRTLLDVLSDPFTQRPGLERYAEPDPSDFGPYVTFCGT